MRRGCPTAWRIVRRQTPLRRGPPDAHPVGPFGARQRRIRRARQPAPLKGEAASGPPVRLPTPFHDRLAACGRVLQSLGVDAGGVETGGVKMRFAGKDVRLERHGGAAATAEGAADAGRRREGRVRSGPAQRRPGHAEPACMICRGRPMRACLRWSGGRLRATGRHVQGGECLSHGRDIAGANRACHRCADGGACLLIPARYSRCMLGRDVPLWCLDVGRQGGVGVTDGRRFQDQFREGAKFAPPPSGAGAQR